MDDVSVKRMERILTQHGILPGDVSCVIKEIGLEMIQADPYSESEKTWPLHLTKSQIDNLDEFFEWNVFENIRNDADIDNIRWLCDMCDLYRKLERLRQIAKKETPECPET